MLDPASSPSFFSEFLTGTLLPGDFTTPIPGAAASPGGAAGYFEAI